MDYDSRFRHWQVTKLKPSLHKKIARQSWPQTIMPMRGARIHSLLSNPSWKGHRFSQSGSKLRLGGCCTTGCTDSSVPEADER